MIPQTTLRTVETSGDMERSSFGISRGDEAHLMTVLRDTLYSDKVLAVLREYSSNAWDAHRDAGKPDVPIKVTLPTLSEPTLVIEDYGSGLSRTDVFGFFTQYGASTKRASNGTVGMLGIGSKAGFAYSDSFTIVSRYGGIRSTYVAVLDSSDRGEVRLLDECATDETGLTIQIAVRPADIREFQEKARELFRYWTPRPALNLELPPEVERLSSGALQTDVTGWTAVMGCVPYRIDLSQIHVPHFVQKLGGVLFFGIGELHVAASREALKYSAQTRATLETKLAAFLDNYVQSALADLETSDLSPWQRRLKAIPLRVFDLQILKPYATWLVSSVKFEHPTLHFSSALKSRGSKYEGVSVRERSRLILRDDKRSMRGFCFSSGDYLVRPVKDYTLTQAVAALLSVCASMQCTGIPIVRTSELVWTQPPREPHRGGSDNVKHKRKCFVLKPSTHGYGVPFSHYWETVSRKPEPTDIYVMLDCFRTEHYNSFSSDMTLLKAFDQTVPPIYGYKEKGTGIQYAEWSNGLADRVLRESGEARQALEDTYFAALLDGFLPSYGLAHIVERLGTEHLVSALLIRARAARNSDKADAGQLLRCLSAKKEDTAKPVIASIYKAHPLLETQKLDVLWGNHADKWLDYILSTTKKARRK